LRWFRRSCPRWCWARSRCSGAQGCSRRWPSSATGAQTLALALQWGLAAAALIAVALAWRTEGIGFDHKAALLVTAILIAPPYLWYGETALLAPALMLLIRAGLIRRTLPGAFLAILMALGVTPYLLAQLLIATEPVPMRLVAAPVLVVAFAVAARPVLARAIRRDGPT
jgi:hypothetical protein